MQADEANIDDQMMMHKILFIARRKSISCWIPLLICALILWHHASTIPLELYSYYDLIRNQKNQASCKLPKLNPYDPSILQYVYKSEPLQCKRFQPELVYLSDGGYLVVNISAANCDDCASAECSFRCLQHDTGVSDDAVKYLDWKPLVGRVKPDCEFMEVSCVKSLLKISVFRYHFAQVIPKIAPLPTSEPAPSPKLNVIVFGIDSMSVSNVVRQMPKSLEYLTSKMHAYVFKGHSKVGDNTWVNMVAMLTGKLVESTKEFPTELNDNTYNRFFDDWAYYVWKNFTAKGYRTLFAEDRPDISTFNYTPKKGFKTAMVDHYLRPYWLSMYWSPLHMRSSAFCYNTIPDHMVQFNYLKQFMQRYSALGLPHFAYTWWQNLSHDLLNRIGVADEDLEQFLMDTHPYVNNNTILIVISDHGHRYDKIRESVVGRLEARLPFLAIAVPPWFKNRYPKVVTNLRQNSDRLTTQFDFYETLRDILDGKFDDVEQQRSPGPLYSLFRPIPDSRYCYVAKIPEEYCPCYQESPLPVTDPRVKEVAAFLLAHANQLLSVHEDKCAKLTLHSIRDAHVFLPTQKMLKDPQVGKKSPLKGFHLSFRLQIETFPNHALLEGVVKRFIDQGTYQIDGDIDRNNAYGNTSHCVNERVLKKLCFCNLSV